VDFGILQKVNAFGRDNYLGSSKRMEVEAMKWMVKRWGGDQKLRL
jgi:hypothetical protein